eukprot:gene21070-23125_t
MSKLTQSTFFKCGVLKQIETATGKKYNITPTLPQTVVGDPNQIRCELCSKAFKAKNHLNNHVLFKHKTHIVAEQRSKSANIEMPIQHLLIVSEIPTTSKRKRTCSSKRRKSYTIDFKVQTLKCLGKLSKMPTVKGKWRNVANERGIPNRSTVIKWNSNRDKIFEEVVRNINRKGKRNTTAVRQRRKLSAERPNKTEKYPAAAKLVALKFKLRRAKGCKVSKMWFCHKMKQKNKTRHRKMQVQIKSGFPSLPVAWIRAKPLFNSGPQGIENFEF